jgi:hypothetical protein
LRLVVNFSFHDYDEVRVKVKEHEIKSLSPNPADQYVSVDYKLGNISSAYLMDGPYGTLSN